MTIRRCLLLIVIPVLLLGGVGTFPRIARSDDSPEFSRERDVIYGRKYGTALTMDVFTPKTPNGVGLVFAVSGGWYSSHQAIHVGFVREFVDRGYTVFAVVHGSQPKYTIPEILEDMHRAVRYVRFHAEEHRIDPDRIGMYGGSAGGHLSLMQGTAGQPGDPEADDPVDRISSRVQAVACFFPPTDFLNYGEKGHVALGRGTLSNFRAPFDFHRYDADRHAFVAITDEEKLHEIGRDISPVYHADEDDPPTLIIHGDADKLVPLQQSRLMVTALQDAGVPVELIVKPDAGHGWPEMLNDLDRFADWFDRHLRNDAKPTPVEEKSPAEAPVPDSDGS